MKRFVSYIIFVAVLICLLGCTSSTPQGAERMSVTALDLSAYSSEKPGKSLNILFIHHSSGAALMAERGEKKGEYCLYDSHPNGGGLRALLQQNNYRVHEATYGSKIGENTDINDWHVKFRDRLGVILRIDRQDKLLGNGEVNNIVIFKSCFPNNDFVSMGKAPGNPDSPERTVWNAKAAYASLLPIFRQNPKTFFVVITAPPLAKPQMSWIKEKLLDLVGKGPVQIASRARAFNNWLKDIKTGWLSTYDLKNVVVFDYYDILTKYGEDDWSKYPTQGGQDSHPSSDGNVIAAQKFILFLNRAVRYAGLSDL